VEFNPRERIAQMLFSTWPPPCERLKIFPGVFLSTTPLVPSTGLLDGAPGDVLELV